MVAGVMCDIALQHTHHILLHYQIGQRPVTSLASTDTEQILLQKSASCPNKFWQHKSAAAGGHYLHGT